MNEFLIYTLRSSLAMGLFAIIYKLAFSKETNFRIRRIYLLLSVFISLIIATIHNYINVQFSILPSILLDEIQIYDREIKTIPENAGVMLSGVLTFVYYGVASYILLRLIFQIINVKIKTLQLENTKLGKLKLYKLPDQYQSFSFFREIFIGKTKSQEDFKKIIEHEKVHAIQWHSLDVLYFELLGCIFWLNPLIWWYRSEIRKVHEYLADEGALDCGFDLISYQITLLEHLIGNSSIVITNNFNYSLIKNRITMMKKEKFRKRNNWKLLFLLPVTFILVFIFACSSQEDLKSSEALKNELIENNDVFDNVDVMPLFNNGDPSVEFRKYIYQNLKYPEIASKKGITGRVIVQFTVNKEGKIVNPSIRSNSDPELNEEVLRLLTSSPNWIPGKQKGNPANVRFTFPVNFILK